MSHLPNFILAGAPKTGTTSLYSYLKQHPDIYMSPVKEPCFFASEMRAENFGPKFATEIGLSSQKIGKYLEGPMSGPSPGGIVTDWNDYLKLFKSVRSEKAIGEASVCYLWSPAAPANIHAKIPQAKIILILRDPAERAFSQYLQYAASGLLTHSFRRHIELCLHNRTSTFGPFRPFLEYGLYYEQVKRYLDLFSPNNVRIYFHEEAWQTPGSFLEDLFGFLDVDSGVEVDTSERSLERRSPKSMLIHRLMKKSGLVPQIKKLLPSSVQARLRGELFKTRELLRLDPDDRRQLQEFYRADIQDLSALLRTDLSRWLA